MRDSSDPVLQAGKRLSGFIEGVAAVPHDDPFSQILWATVMRSKYTFDAISNLVGDELDT